MSSPLAALDASLGANGPGGNAKIDFSVGVTTPADFTSITVSGPGFGSPQALNAPVVNEHGEYEADYIDYGFSSLAALNAKYPLGSTYTFTATASNPALSQTATKTYDANRQPTSSPGGPVVVPLLTAASYASLQGLNVALADTIAFNAPIFGDGARRTWNSLLSTSRPCTRSSRLASNLPRPQVCCSRPIHSRRTPSTPLRSATMLSKTVLSSRITRSASSRPPRGQSPSRRRSPWLPLHSPVSH